MVTILERFVPVQKAIEQGYYQNEYLFVNEIAGLLHVDYFASPFETYFDDLLVLLCDADIASKLKTVRFRSPNHGANGTRHWCFSRIFDFDGVVFPELTHLWIERYDGIEHNHPIVEYKSASYEENGVLAWWLHRSPNLICLASPSAPNADFFKQEAPALKQLYVQAGYDNQSFIANLADATCFPNLRVFEYWDYDQPYIADYQTRCTPLEQFQRLFQSDAFDPIRSFTWYNPIFDRDELKQLKALRPRMGFRVVRISYDWV